MESLPVLTTPPSPNSTTLPPSNLTTLLYPNLIILPPDLTNMAIPPELVYVSREALFKAIQNWAKLCGYAFTTGKSKHIEDSGY